MFYYFISKKRKIYHRHCLIGYEIIDVLTKPILVKDKNIIMMSYEKDLDPEDYFFSIKYQHIFPKNKNKMTESKYITRQTTASKLLEKIYPNHHVIWIDDYISYYYISKYLEEKSKEDVVILQTEEDFFHFFDLLKLRRDIKNDPNWTDNSFLITNSLKDFNISKKIIKSEHKPGILDLIAYRRYEAEEYVLALEKIRYHTGFLYQVHRAGRGVIAKLLKQYETKTSVILYRDYEYYSNNIKTVFSIFPGDSGLMGFNAPYLDIARDYTWSKHSAFIISMETYHHGSRSAEIKDNYAPTLSEKTYKAMHLLRPALVFGGPGTRDYLKKFGFDTWDWLIDWSFDEEQDYEKSLFLYGKELKRLLDTDIEVIKEKIRDNQDALLYNRKRIFELIKNYRNI